MRRRQAARRSTWQSEGLLTIDWHDRHESSMMPSFTSRSLLMLATRGANSGVSRMKGTDKGFETTGDRGTR